MVVYYTSSNGWDEQMHKSIIYIYIKIVFFSDICSGLIG